MKLYDEETKSKVNNYMIPPKHLTTPKTHKHPIPTVVKK